MDITIKGNVVWLGWGYRNTENEDPLRDVNQEALLRQWFLAHITQWMVVSAPRQTSLEEVHMF